MAYDYLCSRLHKDSITPYSSRGSIHLSSSRLHKGILVLLISRVASILPSNNRVISDTISSMEVLLLEPTLTG